MKVDQAFPSKWLKSGDIPKGKKIKVTLDYVTIEKMGDDEKPVLHFVGKEKGMACNRTNANIIASVYGEEMDDWNGKDIFIYVGKTQFKGQVVDGLMVDVPRVEVAELDEEPPF